MPLPWVRLDSNIPTNTKMLLLLADPSPKRWQAAASYMFALAHSGGQDTGGRIRTVELPYVHGTTATARLLVKYGLWEECADGWQIHNYAHRNQTEETTTARLVQLTEASHKGNCSRWHPKGCWKEASGCSRGIA